ncbi:MAG: hypothetical protein WAM21_03245, partial [Steroidobacteraceae bacterium]
MTKPRARRQAKTDDLVEAILRARGGARIAYRSDWHEVLVAWFYFGDAPVGVERLAAAGVIFDQT